MFEQFRRRTSHLVHVSCFCVMGIISLPCVTLRDEIKTSAHPQHSALSACTAKCAYTRIPRSRRNCLPSSSCAQRTEQALVNDGALLQALLLTSPGIVNQAIDSCNRRVELPALLRALPKSESIKTEWHGPLAGRPCAPSPGLPSGCRSPRLTAQLQPWTERDSNP
jgi:hypothetical protein